MKKFQPWRSAFYIVEQNNGYFAVHCTVTDGNDDKKHEQSYPNLSWVEVGTLVLSQLESWGELEKSEGTKVAFDPWVQLSLLPLPD